MPGSREIRNKIRSIKNTQKITKAMEMVAASKMRKAQERTRASRPYAFRVLDIVTHLARAHTEYQHPFLTRYPQVKRIGVIVITTDKGLCGGLNTNLLRMLLSQVRAWQQAGLEMEFCAIGTKGLGFLQRMGASVVSEVVHLGDTPHLERLIGATKIMLDAYSSGRVQELYVFYNRFINTMKQEPWRAQLLPLPQQYRDERGEVIASTAATGLWDYLYEPDAKSMLDAVLTRYIESRVYQAVAENMACEQSARMVAMKAASDNAGSLIDELTLIYNKARQASITKELSEIVGGAAAV
jgi:F-type H+-transporting ATPase subunit gamma